MKDIQINGRKKDTRFIFSLSRKSVKRLMREQPIAPPAHIWNKIEEALDLQDAGSLPRKSLSRTNSEVKKRRYLDFAAAVTVLAGLMKL